jgi:hypothetical protein
VGGFPSAPAAPRQRVEPKRLHSAWLTSCGTRHHTACHCDKVRVEDLNLDGQFLQSTPVQKHRVGAHTKYHKFLQHACRNIAEPTDDTRSHRDL